MRVLSVNLAHPFTTPHTNAEGGLTGIDKRPADGPVTVTAPASGGSSGLAGDLIGDATFHGGPDKAVYAYAREDLDRWESELGRPLANGVFGENLTTGGIAVSDVRIGERWRIGGTLLLEATSPRIPCRTFAAWLEERHWVKRFTQAGASGVYLRVLEPGTVRAGDLVEVVERPGHEVSVEFVFRAVTGATGLRPRVIAAGEALGAEELALARRWAAAAS